MIGFYAFILLTGVFVFAYVLRHLMRLRRIGVFMSIVDAKLPSVGDSRPPIYLVVLSHVMTHFAPIYDPIKGLYLRRAMFVLALALALVVLNDIFLRLHFMIMIIIGILLGNAIVKKFQEIKTRNDFEDNFPEALVILNGAMASGSNIIQALQYYATSSSGVICDEFKIVVKRLNIGEDPARVFSDSYKRLPFPNYYFFLISILVSMKSGARVKEILSRLGEATSNAKIMEKKKLAMTSEARMSAKITGAIPFVFLFLMKFISPSNFDYILNDENGRYILYYFLTSECIGILVMTFLMRKL